MTQSLIHKVIFQTSCQFTDNLPQEGRQQHQDRQQQEQQQQKQQHTKQHITNHRTQRILGTITLDTHHQH